MRSDAIRLSSTTAQAIVGAAQARGIPCLPLYRSNLIQLGYGRHRRLIHGSRTDSTSMIGGDLARDKRFAKRVFERASVPYPKGFVARTREEALDAFRDLGAPVVIKPSDGHHGQGVTLNIVSREQVEPAFALACRHSNEGSALVEETLTGHNVRVFLIGFKVVAASEHIPAHVVGDGRRNIAELVEEENKNPLRGERHELPLCRIQVNQPGLDLLRVPALSEQVFVSATANISTGGTARDVTDELHPETRCACERIARLINLDVCGIDLIVEDLTRPLWETPGGFLEVNTRPGLSLHENPTEGRARAVAAAIVDHLFPPGAKFRVPVIGVPRTREGAEAARAVRELLQQAGKSVGEDLADPIAEIVILDSDRLPPEGADIELSAVECAAEAAQRASALC